MKTHVKGGLRKWRNKSIIINFYVDRQEKVTTVAFSRIYLNVYLKVKRLDFHTRRHEF